MSVDHICISHTDEDCKTCIAIEDKYEEILNSHCKDQHEEQQSTCLYYGYGDMRHCDDAHECPRVIDYFENMPTEE